MTEQNQVDKKQSNLKSNMGLIFALGLVGGSVLGNLTSNYGMGLATGLAVANLVLASIQLKAKEKGSTAAVVISVLGVAAVIGLWIWSA